MFRREPHLPAGGGNPLLVAELSERIQAEYERLTAHNERALRILRSTTQELTPDDRHALLQWSKLRRYRRWTLRALLAVIALGGFTTALTILANQPPHAAVADLLIGPGTGVALWGLLSAVLMSFDALIERTSARELTSLYGIAAATLTMTALAIGCSDSSARVDGSKVFIDVTLVAATLATVLMSLMFSHTFSRAARQLVVDAALPPADARARITPMKGTL